MKITILGKGNVGSSLGKKWAWCGHKVTYGVRDPEDEGARALVKEQGATAMKVEDACGGAEVILLAVPWNAVEDVLSWTGNIEGKVVLDATNPLKPDMSGLDPGEAPSGGERVAELARGAHVVKIFNTTGVDNMKDPKYPSGPLPMLFAGDDEAAKKTAAKLAKLIGFEPVDVGALSASRWLEQLALVWITLAYKREWGTDFALGFLKRKP